MTGRPTKGGIFEEKDTPAPNHYGLPNMYAASSRRRIQSPVVLNGPRGGPISKGGTSPDPTTYHCKLYDLNPEGKITSRAERIKKLTLDDDPGPGHYPSKSIFDPSSGKPMSFAGRPKDGSQSSPELAFLRYTPEDKVVKEKPPVWKLNHTSQRSSVGTATGTPGPGAYKPSCDYDSTKKKILGRSWKQPTPVKKPRGTLKQVSNTGGEIAHYGLFFDKQSKVKRASTASTMMSTTGMSTTSMSSSTNEQMTNET